MIPQGSPSWLLALAILGAVVAGSLQLSDTQETSYHGTGSEQEDLVAGSQIDFQAEAIAESRGLLETRAEKLIDYDSEHPDAYRSAPSSRQSPPDYVITRERLRKIRSEFMYWYFDKQGDSGHGDLQTDITSSVSQIHKSLNFQLPFFGFRYNYTRLSLNGYLEFSDPPQHLTYPLIFPIKDWPKSNDPAFIGIFYSKCRVGKLKDEDVDKRTPGVYFRLERDLQKRNDKFGIEMRERLTWDIREGIIGSDSFFPKHAIIITWKNVTFTGGIDISYYKTNTFQMVLATDEVYTYAIFNYLDIKWTTHTEAGGDTTNGELGTPAYIGFNGGNGTQSYEYLPYSQQTTVRDLPGRGWVNGFPGRHIFRIDEKIMLGNCNKDIAGANLPLVFAPESGNMLGGTIVNITGPCFKPNDKIRCRFEEEEVTGTVIDTNRAVCIQPFIFADGYIRFAIAINNGRFDYKGKFFIETPATATEKISFMDKSVHERSPSEIRITWAKYNLTSNLDAKLQISLWGYREKTIRPQLEYINMIASNEPNSGYFVITPGNFRDRNDPFTNDMEFGFLQINMSEPMSYNGSIVNPVIWSKPIPLGWYFGPQWERLYGNNWPQRLCNQWIMHDRYLKNFASQVPMCPCKLEHALNDKGRFMPDYHCDKDSNPDCYYNKGAYHCVTTGSPNLDGAEQQCCYDKNYMLMLTYDQQWGSRPRRSHNIGFLPWNEANKVPTLSHWFHDMVPMYSCCLWQDEQAVGCETYRFERRPSQDCVAYQSPSIGAVFGGNHFYTFDALQYTFNGKGEFVLTRVDDIKDKLDIQARFEQLPDSKYGEVRATHLTAIAARGNNSVPIEVRLRPPYAQWRYRLDVFAENKRVYFDRTSLKFQHFRGVMVYTPTYILNQSEVIIMFDTGAGIEVVENEGYMTARVYLPWSYMNKTRGLLGNFSNNILDDFVNPDGMITTVVENLTNFESAHKDFGMSWLIEDHEDSKKGGSLFTREFGRTASYYTNKTFEPEFRKTPDEIIPPWDNRTEDRIKAREYCGESYQCQYDYALTNNENFAKFTKQYFDTVTQIRESNLKPFISCGVLETPRFGRKSNFLFYPGQQVAFECNQDFVLIGDQKRTCLPDGHWDLPEYGYTECLQQVEYSRRTFGQALWFIGALLIPAVILVFCLIGMAQKRTHKKSSQSGKSQPDSGKSSWRFSERSPSSSRQTTPLKLRTASPLSDSSAGSKPSELHKRRRYDGVYHTHEPLPGKPDIDFEDKEWDLTLSNDPGTISPASTTSSGLRRTPTATAVASADPTLPSSSPSHNRDPIIYDHSSEV